jgi:predicted RNA binding protein YcfA (HicA-like mRNA interferase family)
MNRLPRCTGREALAALRRARFIEDRVEGGHHVLIGPQRQRVTVPVHAGETF